MSTYYIKKKKWLDLPPSCFACCGYHPFSCYSDHFPASVSGEGGGTQLVHGRSRVTIDSCIPITNINNDGTGDLQGVALSGSTPTRAREATVLFVKSFFQAFFFVFFFTRFSGIGVFFTLLGMKMLVSLLFAPWLWFSDSNRTKRKDRTLSCQIQRKSTSREGV